MTQPQDTAIPPGYRDVSVPLDELARTAVVPSLALLIAPLLLYLLAHGPACFIDTVFTDWFPLLILPALIGGIVIHEGLHALGWMLAGRLSWRALSFGFDRKTATPYAHARSPMTARAYRFGAALPAIVTGIVPAALGLITGFGGWALLGAVMLMLAVGDVMILVIIRAVPPSALVLDHPTQAGCLVKIA